MGKNPDVIVIGGGITGCAAAYYLARQGASVTLFEKDSIASHASGFAFGGILTRGGVEEGHPLHGLALAADELHTELEASLAAESGVDPEYVHRAAVFLAMNEADAESCRQAYRRHLHDKRSDVHIRWLSRGELSHIEARIGPEVLGGLYHGDALEVEPYKLTFGLWQAAERRGAQLVNRSVTGLVKSGSRVRGVIAGDARLEAGAVVIASGPWSVEAGKWLGARLPVEPLKGQIIRLEAPQPHMEVSFWWGGDYCSTKSDGLLWVGTTEERAGFDENPTAAARDRITASAVRAFPYLREASLVKQTACLRPLSADRLPLVGLAPGVEGAVIATGAGRSGIELGPALGKAAAELALTRNAPFDISGLRPERFNPRTSTR
jgi:glycine oxidase